MNLNIKMDRSETSFNQSDESEETATIEESWEPESRSSQIEGLCEQHGKTLDGYCRDCEVLICIECIFQKHRNHDIHSLVQVIVE